MPHRLIRQANGKYTVNYVDQPPALFIKREQQILVLRVPARTQTLATGRVVWTPWQFQVYRIVEEDARTMLADLLVTFDSRMPKEPL